MIKLRPRAFHPSWKLIKTVTVIGIPIGLQCLKMAKLSLLPFGAQVM